MNDAAETTDTTDTRAMLDNALTILRNLRDAGVLDIMECGNVYLSRRYVDHANAVCRDAVAFIRPAEERENLWTCPPDSFFPDPGPDPGDDPNDPGVPPIGLRSVCRADVVDVYVSTPTNWIVPDEDD